MAKKFEKGTAALFKSQNRLTEIMREKSGKPAPEGAQDQGMSGTSIFDPVLVELLITWFSPPGGLVLDPFAGGSVRGIVTNKLGRKYVGCDLREEQIIANRLQGKALCPGNEPVWHAGDSQLIEQHAPGAYDFILSCPPYADLEVYSDDKNDLSTMEYPKFIEIYRKIIAACVRMLKPNRFAAFVVGDVRNEKGHLRGFPFHTVQAFEDAGAFLYNDCTLVTSVGSLPIRTGRQFAGGRKLGRTHQDVFVFIKGDWKQASIACGEL